MKMKTLVTILLAMALMFSVTAVPTYAAELPEGVVQVFKVANDGNTRNQDWKDLETGIITLPLGQEFDNGSTNHGVYHMYSPVVAEDIYYAYWIINVEENDELYEDDIILAYDPWYLQSYEWPEGGDPTNEVASSDSPGGTLLEDYDGLEIYYEDVEAGKWQIVERGFEVMEDNTQYVQHRLHYRNMTSVQVKYLIVTTQPMVFAVNEETGEVDGVTNDKDFIVVTPEPTPEPTPTPEATSTPEPTEAPVTQAPAPATDAPATTEEAPATTEPAVADNEDTPAGAPIGLIIGIIAAVAVVAVVVVIVLKKKKQ